MFSPICDNHIPVKPPTVKTNKYATANIKDVSTFKAPFSSVKVQFTTFIVAGNEIIIVIVLYNDRLL
jgi:hypothetical protein